MTEQRENKRKKRIVAVLVGFAMVGAGGVAYSYWTQDGEGTGSATTGTTADVVVTQTNTVIDIKPGLDPIALVGELENTAGNGAVTVGTLTASVGEVAAVGCEADDYVITGTAVIADTTLADGQTTTWSGLSIAFVNEAAEDQNGCKGATVPINYALSAS